MRDGESGETEGGSENAGEDGKEGGRGIFSELGEGRRKNPVRR